MASKFIKLNGCYPGEDSGGRIHLINIDALGIIKPSTDLKGYNTLIFFKCLVNEMYDVLYVKETLEEIEALVDVNANPVQCIDEPSVNERFIDGEGYRFLYMQSDKGISLNKVIVDIKYLEKAFSFPVDRNVYPAENSINNEILGAILKVDDALYELWEKIKPNNKQPPQTNPESPRH